MLHDYETIVRKVRMGGQVLPSETVLVIREILNRLEGLQEKFDGLETSINLSLIHISEPTRPY